MGFHGRQALVVYWNLRLVFVGISWSWLVNPPFPIRWPTRRVMDCDGNAVASTPLSPATAARKLKTISASSVAKSFIVLFGLIWFNFARFIGLFSDFRFQFLPPSVCICGHPWLKIIF